MHVIGNSGAALVVALLSALPLSSTSLAHALADTLDVPGEHTTIQAAILAAQPGDTVLVAPGTYVERIDFLGRAITVESSGGPAVTIIDGDGGGSVVTFRSGETSASVLRGFTVTGGSGSKLALFGNDINGGGIHILGPTSPVIQQCKISGNTAEDFGGGVYVDAQRPLFEDCTISGNSSARGGGLCVDFSGAAELRGCTLADNSASIGGGFGALRNARLAMSDCLIEDNLAGTGGGGSFRNDYAGPDLCVLERCTFSGNSATGSGGGLALVLGTEDLQAGTASISGCRFVGNTAGVSGGGLDARPATFVLPDSISVRDCLFTGNSAGSSGGALRASALTSLVCCTVVGNSSPGGGGLFADALSVSPTHCIFWGNSSAQISGTLPDPGFCDIQGGSPGTGNIDIEPLFADAAAGDFHLAPSSACVDAGDPAFVPVPAAETDFDGDARVLGARVDLGADETTFAKSPWTFLGHALAGDAQGAPSLTGSGALLGDTLARLALSGAAPGRPSWLVIGADSSLLPFKGGVLVPTVDELVGPLVTGPAGSYALGARWPIGISPGFVIRVQAWIADTSGPHGFTASNGLAAQAQ